MLILVLENFPLHTELLDRIIYVFTFHHLVLCIISGLYFLPPLTLVCSLQIKRICDNVHL